MCQNNEHVGVKSRESVGGALPLREKTAQIGKGTVQISLADPEVQQRLLSEVEEGTCPTLGDFKSASAKVRDVVQTRPSQR